MRRTHLSRFPPAHPASRLEVVAVAQAIRQDGDRRFADLAAEMDQRGESELAEIFRRMRAEEMRRTTPTAARAPPAGRADAPRESATTAYASQILTELAASWDEAAFSTLVTPYRVLATAVANQERLFAFYAYLAAHAADPEAAEEAGEQARDSLDRAASLRRRRRAAYRREGLAGRAAPPRIGDADALAALLARHEQAIAACHLGVAARLEQAGDAEAAALLRADQPGRRETVAAGRPWNDGREAGPAALLLAAQKPLESLAEILEQVAATATDEAVRQRAQDYLQTLLERIAPIASAIRARLGRRTAARPGQSLLDEGEGDG